jgi:hypothetical protein
MGRFAGVQVSGNRQTVLKGLGFVFDRQAAGSHEI